MNEIKILFTVLGRPRGKERVAEDPRRGGKNRRFAAPKTLGIERDIGNLCRTAMGSKQPMSGPVRVTIEAIFAIPKSWKRDVREAAMRGAVHCTKKPDTDNIAKIVFDGLNGVAWQDDAQVAGLLVLKRYGEPERIDVKLEPCPNPLGVTEEPVETPGDQRRRELAERGLTQALGRKLNLHNANSVRSPRTGDGSRRETKSHEPT